MSSKSSSVGIKNVAYLLVSQRVRQRVQRLMLATPRTEAVRETEKVFLVYLIEDGDHGLLDDLVLQRRIPNGRCRPSPFSMYILLDRLALYVPRCTRLCRPIRRSCKSGSYSCHFTPSTPGPAFRLRA